MASRLFWLVLLMTVVVIQATWSGSDVADSSEDFGEDARGYYQNPFDEQWLGYGGYDNLGVSSDHEGYGTRTRELKHLYPLLKA